MKFPKWICINCGQPSSRKYNIHRHIETRHNGIGEFVSFTEYLAGRHTGIYPPSSVPTYHSRTNHLDIFVDEVNRELARKIVNQNFPQISIGHQNQYGHTTSNSSSSTSHTKPSPIDSDDIIGYRGYVCNDCLGTNMEEMHFGAYNGKGIGKMKHVCEPKELAESRLYNNTDKSFRLEEMEKKLPLHIRNLVVNNWTKNQNYLVAKELPNQEEIEENIDQNYIDLTLTNNNSYDYWPIRAVKNNHILLSENEFIDFMHKVRNATFGIFKIKIFGSVHFYVMAITNGPLRPSTFS
ncbi:MAG TPA: hypothetical protein VKA91_10230 [Nitrososphaeraceae archaeon]|nr:hypothetical protein [Nitrososphaeraceae archaeon]